MNEAKKYMLTRNDVEIIIGVAAAEAQGVSDTEGLANELLEAHEYHERTCHNEERVCDDIFVCSECKAQYATRGYIEDLNIVTSDGKWVTNNYCPNCGAKVVEE